MSTAEVSNILMYLEPVRVDVGAPLLPPPAGELHDKAFGGFSSRLQQGGLRDPLSRRVSGIPEAGGSQGPLKQEGLRDP